jgi:phenylacetate-CoA ligase
MPDLVSLYQRLPYPLRSAAASLHGLRLRAIRYSADTDRLAAEAQERERWSAAQWQAWQQERLAQTLLRAARDVPYYRSQWDARRRQGDRAAQDLLTNWPVLSKDLLRAQPAAFLSDQANLRAQVTEHTSGTSGTPLTLQLSRSAVRQWYVLFEARWRGWYGLSRHDRWGILGGQLVAAYDAVRPPFWVWNAGLNQLYLSSYHLSARTVPAYLQAIRQHRLVYLLGYASTLYALSQLALELNDSIPPLKAVISNAEPLYPYQREMIGRAFQCQVHDTYGQSENVCAASECAQGRMHLWPEVGLTEIFAEDADVPAAPGTVGRIVSTGLLNDTMPLIRYQVGDRGAIQEYAACACGRNMPSLSSIEGRCDDVIITPDGRKIGRLDPVFKASMPVREAQIIQETLSLLRLKIVPAPGYCAQDGENLVRRLQERVGGMDVIIEEVESIPRSANGKFRAVISNLEKHII